MSDIGKLPPYSTGERFVTGLGGSMIVVGTLFAAGGLGDSGHKVHEERACQPARSPYCQERIERAEALDDHSLDICWSGLITVVGGAGLIFAAYRHNNRRHAPVPTNILSTSIMYDDAAFTREFDDMVVYENTNPSLRPVTLPIKKEPKLN